MLGAPWTISTESAADSSVGASAAHYMVQWSHNLLTNDESESSRRASIRFVLEPPLTSTERSLPKSVDELLQTFSATSLNARTVHLQRQTRDQNARWFVLSQDSVFLDEDPTRGFLALSADGLNGSLSADLTDVRPSLRIATLPAYPITIQQALSQLEDGQAGEKGWYDAAEEIAYWLEEDEHLAHQDRSLALLSIVSSLPPASLGTLLSALADREVPIHADSIINRIAELMYATDKRLAQTAALCLIGCSGNLGRELVQRAITQSPPHANLLAGLIKLTA